MNSVFVLHEDGTWEEVEQKDVFRKPKDGDLIVTPESIFLVRIEKEYYIFEKLESDSTTQYTILTFPSLEYDGTDDYIEV